jgi:hypothetical protein
LEVERALEPLNAAGAADFAILDNIPVSFYVKGYLEQISGNWYVKF